MQMVIKDPGNVDYDNPVVIVGVSKSLINSGAARWWVGRGVLLLIRQEENKDTGEGNGTSFSNTLTQVPWELREDI